MNKTLNWVNDYTNHGLYLGKTILTRCGKFVHPFWLSEDEVEILDIAWGLSGEGRFTNHSIKPYVVGQHSIWMTKVALERNYPNEVAYQCLLHDSTEAYLGDVSSPVKEFLPEYKSAEIRAWNTIATVLYCNPSYDKRVKELDILAFNTELRDLMPKYNKKDHSIDYSNVHPDIIVPMDRIKVFKEFLLLYECLKPEQAPSVSSYSWTIASESW